MAKSLLEKIINIDQVEVQNLLNIGYKWNTRERAFYYHKKINGLLLTIYPDYLIELGNNKVSLQLCKRDGNIFRNIGESYEKYNKFVKSNISASDYHNMLMEMVSKL